MALIDNMEETTRIRFSALNSTLISSDSFFNALFDRNISKATERKIIEADEHFLHLPKYLQYEPLAEGLSSKEILEKYFYADRKINIALVSSIIDDCPTLTYADFIAEFCADKTIPFIAGLLMLNAYREEFGGFVHYIKKTAETVSTGVLWEPVEAPVTPPVLYQKLSNARKPSANGLDDNYIVQTYIDSGYNTEFASIMLGISRPTLLKRLRAVHFIGANGKVKQSPEEWFKTHSWLDEPYRDDEPSAPVRKQQKEKSPDSFFAFEDDETEVPPVIISDYEVKPCVFPDFGPATKKE